jgi:hypothetical protein
MKTGLKTKWGLFLVIVLVFFTGNAALAGSSWGCETEVSGYVCDIVYKIDDDPSAIAVGEDCAVSDSWVYVYGIPFYHLAKKHDLDLEEYLENVEEITIWAHECPTAKEDGQLKACEINDIELFPPNLEPKNFSADVNGKKGNYGRAAF